MENKIEVYINELPKCCNDCPCEGEYYCGITGYELYDEICDETKRKDCPLINIKTHDEKLLKEEKEKTLLLYSVLYELLEKQGNDNVASQIDYLTKQNYSEICNMYKNIKNFQYINQELQNECNIWGKACELACAEISKNKSNETNNKKSRSKLWKD